MKYLAQKFTNEPQFSSRSNEEATQKLGEITATSHVAAVAQLDALGADLALINPNSGFKNPAEGQGANYLIKQDGQWHTARTDLSRPYPYKTLGKVE